MIRQDRPRVMKVAYGSANDTTNDSSSWPTILRVLSSLIRKVRSSGIMERLS